MKKKGLFQIYRRAIRAQYRAAPLRFLLSVLIDVLHGASYVLIAYTSQGLFEAITALYRSEGQLALAGRALLFFFLAKLFQELANALSNFPVEQLPPKLLLDLHRQIQKKLAKLSPLLFQDPEALDQIHRARTGVDQAVFATLVARMLLSFYLPYFIFLSLYLGSLSPALLLILVAVFIPVGLGQGLRMQRYRRLGAKMAKEERRLDAYAEAIAGPRALKETRLLGAYAFLAERYQEAGQQRAALLWETARSDAKIDGLLKLLSGLGYAGILGLLLWQLRQGKISVGAFAAVFSTSGMIFQLAEECMGNLGRQLARRAPALENIQTLLDGPLAPREQHEGKNKAAKGGAPGLQVKGLSFQYPGAKALALEGIDFDLASGEILAIVGENGAGKSTLAKLLLGLYEPRTGQVFRQGQCTKQHPMAHLAAKESACFQDFQRYASSLGKNVSLAFDSQGADERSAQCLKAAGFHKKNLGLDGLLSRIFGGRELSGGEWQRVALARALYKESSLLLFDEPTAAIDPLEARFLYAKFRQFCQGKTGILVTHRLAAAQVADQVLVLKDGKMEAMGSHQSLLAAGGHYAKLYESQAKWYREKDMEETL